MFVVFSGICWRSVIGKKCDKGSSVKVYYGVENLTWTHRQETLKVAYENNSARMFEIWGLQAI